MTLRTLVLLATSMLSLFSNLTSGLERIDTKCPEIIENEPELPKISLAQFAFDILHLDGIEAALDTIKKYHQSDQFYFSKDEIYKTGHILYSSGMQSESKAIFSSIEQFFPDFKDSFVHQLFVKAANSTKEHTKLWLKANRNNPELYLNQIEFLIAINTLMDSSDHDMALLLAKINLEEFPNEEDNHVLLARAYNQTGKQKLAMQHMRNSFLTLDYISFPELATKPSTIYIPTVLPRDTASLFSFDGAMVNDTAYLFVQGGPMPDLSAYRVRPLDLLTDKDQILKVDVLQTQMINQSILTAIPELSQDQLLYEHKLNAEILHRTVTFLQNRGKTVFVIGHSYGCYIGIEYLYSKTNSADKLILMAADFDEDPRNFQSNEDGTRKFIRWQQGITPYETNFWGGFPLASLLRDKMEGIFANTEGLVSAPASRKHSQLLKGKDLSNVLFYHARFDEANGRTSQSELEFLSDHGARSIETFGDHHSMLGKNYMENIYDYLTENGTLKESLASALANDLQVKGWQLAITNFRMNKRSEEYFEMSEEEMNNFGYQLIAKGLTSEALEIFKINTKAFPNSWNAFDSLGETYLALGNKKEAHENYRKSLTLNPANIFAIKAIRQISN